MAAPRTSTPGKMPEILTSPSLAAWFGVHLSDMIDREEREAAEAGLSRAAKVDIANLRRVVAQVEGFHAADAA